MTIIRFIGLHLLSLWAALSFLADTQASVVPPNPPGSKGGATSGLEDTAARENGQFGRVAADSFILTPEQIETFHREGCVTIPNVLTEEEVSELETTFDRFLSSDIPVPAKDFCDMSKPFGVPREQWSIVNCMLPTKYHPPFQNNLYERLTRSMAAQLFPQQIMAKDYDQLLTKLPGKADAVFAWHQDMGYWPGPAALGVDVTSTCTFSLAIDNSLPENGCLRYVSGSGIEKKLRKHEPLSGSREEGHALSIRVDEDREPIRLAPAKRGSITIHDEWVVHGSGGNTSPTQSRRTYVVAYRDERIVQAERAIGFTHSHNDDVNWDTFQDGESHRNGNQQKKGDNKQDKFPSEQCETE